MKNGAVSEFRAHLMKFLKEIENGENKQTGNQFRLPGTKPGGDFPVLIK
jgi:hypothetical protein